MRFECPRTLLCFLVLLLPGMALGSLSLSRNSRTFETQQASLITKGLAFACLALPELPDGLPCHPAFTPRRKSSGLAIEGLLSNGYPTLETMRQLLSGQVDEELVSRLFDRSRVLQIEGNLEIDFLSPYLNARYTPYTVKYFSVVRNEANPQVDLFAVQEDNVLLQSGWPLNSGLWAGAQLRRVYRKFVRQEFALIDLTTDAGKSLLTPQSQTGVYFEPGVVGFLSDPWHSRLSLLWTNWGLQSGDFVHLPERPELQVAFAVSPPLLWGELDLEIDLRSLSYEERDDYERLHGGVLYRLGAMNLAGGLDNNGISSAVHFSLHQFNAGIAYSTTQVPWRRDDYYAQTVYVQMGWQI